MVWPPISICFKGKRQLLKKWPTSMTLAMSAIWRSGLPLKRMILSILTNKNSVEKRVMILNLRPNIKSTNLLTAPVLMGSIISVSLLLEAALMQLI